MFLFLSFKIVILVLKVANNEFAILKSTMIMEILIESSGKMWYMNHICLLR